MILGTYGSNIDTYLSLEEKRIDTAKAHSHIKYLFKFINDMTGAVKYGYGTKGTTNDRYVKNTITHNTSENIYTGNINFKPYGFWKYEVYEVTWQASPNVSSGYAPTNENEVLSPADNHKGVVKGKVEEGKLYIQETSGQEQVKYTKYEPSSSTNYLYTN
jgi:hypothetical protein